MQEGIFVLFLLLGTNGCVVVIAFQPWHTRSKTAVCFYSPRERHSAVVTTSVVDEFQGLRFVIPCTKGSSVLILGVQVIVFFDAVELTVL